MNFTILLPVVALMIALRFTRLNMLGWLAAWWLASYVTLNFAIVPPLPSSIVLMFMAIITLALLVYLSADSKNLESVKRGFIKFLVDKKYTVVLIIVVFMLPALVALQVYTETSKQPQPPTTGRTIHPAPPVEILYNEKKINLNTAINPYRKLDEADPETFLDHLKNGRRVYYQNCVFCHGDNLQGKGIFTHGLDPIPANFTDPTTIAMLQEAYLFWRIAKGAPGLPAESSPWASSMPAWEKFLTEEEIWDVILFLYDFTGQKPRA